MPLPKYKKKDEIPKGFEELYDEKDGEWQPKAADTSATEKLEASLEKERKAAKEAAKKSKELEEEKADLERKLAAAAGGDEKDRVTKALAKFDQDLAAEKAKSKTAIDAAQAELRTLKLDDKIKAAALAAGVLPAKVDAVLKLTKESFDLAEDGRIVVKDAKGEVTTGTVADFFGKTYKTQMPELYAGTKAAGGGAPGGGGARPATAGASTLTAEDLMKNPLRGLQVANEEAAAAAK